MNIHDLSRQGLVLDVAATIGRGPNQLAAFDDALINTGIANYNLVRLSSVIPPASTVRVVTAATPPGQWGDRLYVVYAHQPVDGADGTAAAGIGWVQDPDTGAGLFVEHEDPSEDRVRELISESLATMCATRRFDVPPPSMETISTRGSDDESRCAFVVAVYASAGWQGADSVTNNGGSPR
jgi:arginine decarboxylase